MRYMSIAMILAVCTLPAWAEDNPADMTSSEAVMSDKGQWSGNADIGYSASDGNSESQNLYGAGNLEYLKGLWTNKLRLNAVREDDEGATTAERYELGYKLKRALSENSYLFGNLAYERDEFGGVYERTSETVGYGRKLLDTEVHKLEAEIGVGARQSELQDGSEEEDAIVRLDTAYERVLSDTASLNQDLIVEFGEENTYVESISGLKVRINGNLYAKLLYTVKHNDTVPAGIEKTDTYTTVNLSYEFGNH